MTDQLLINKVSTLEKVVQDANDRTLRLGEKVEKLKDTIQTDLFPKVAKIEGRVDMLVWIVGIALSIYMALVIAEGIQLYSLNGRTAGLESDVHRMAATVDAIRIKQVAANPSDIANITEAQSILVDAKNRKLKIPRREIDEAAARFLSASSSNPEAWRATVAFVDYKSFLNVPENPAPGPLEKAPKGSRFKFDNPIKGTLNLGLAGELVPPEKVPQMRLLTSLQPNPSDVSGLIPKYIKLVGGTLTLDGLYMKQIVLESVHVTYRGGQVELEDVHFINCTFDFAPEPQERQLDFAKSVLSSASVTFRAS